MGSKLCQVGGAKGKTVGGPGVLNRSPASARELDGALRGHRRDIDGLRGVSIAAVVLYHLGLGVSGGYGGVDIFFVISGFLIAGIIYRELESGTFSLANFYVRRCRRILPALFVMIFATTAAAALVLLPQDFKNFARSLIAAATSTSNYHFMDRTGYFDGLAIEKPLLHTWSLSVEEQFYLAFPLLLLVVVKFAPRAMVALFAAAAVASFVSNVRDVELIQSHAFFATPGRVWELLIGVLVALGAVPAASSSIVRNGEAFFGLLMIAFGFLTYTEATAYPGFAALPFCVGAAMLIHSGISGEATMVAKFLSLPAVAGLGLISYSVYLIHWPLIVLVNYCWTEMSGGPHILLGTTLFVASIFLGYISWRWVEVPFRKLPRQGGTERTFAFAASAIFGTVLLAVLIERSGGWPARWNAEVLAIANQAPSQIEENCRSQSGAKLGRGMHDCRIGNLNAPADTVLWGDSHANAMLVKIGEVATKHNSGLLAITAAGCPPLFGLLTSGKDKSASCGFFNSATFQRAMLPAVKRVILVARWALYAEGVGTYGESMKPYYLSSGVIGDNPKIFDDLLTDTVRRLAVDGREVIVVGPIPEQTFDVAQALAKQVAWSLDRPPEGTLTNFFERQRHVLETLGKLATLPKVRVIFPHHSLCDDRACKYEVGRQPLYRDSNHLTPAGATELEVMLNQVFETPSLQIPPTTR